MRDEPLLRVRVINDEIVVTLPGYHYAALNRTLALWPHQAASALPASASMCSQCLAINFAASLETRSKSLPTSERHSELSGWADQPLGAARYFEIEPESRMKAQSAFAVLQADNRNTVAIRSGPSCSSMIVSAKGRISATALRSKRPQRRFLKASQPRRGV